MSNLADSWNQIKAWLEANAPAIYSVQNSSAAGAKTIKRACKGLELRPPDDYQDWILNVANGQRMNNVHNGGTVPSRDQNSVIGICDVVGAGTTTGLMRDYFKRPPKPDDCSGAVHPVAWHQSWFAFAWDNTNDDGIYLAFEMEPPEGGTPGQVIYIREKPRTRRVVCESFTQFLTQLAQAYANDEYVYNGAKNTIAKRNPESFPNFDA